jgi:16S rRNA (cytidine1402-2'-O)-methyltransferase
LPASKIKYLKLTLAALKSCYSAQTRREPPSLTSKPSSHGVLIHRLGPCILGSQRNELAGPIPESVAAKPVPRAALARENQAGGPTRFFSASGARLQISRYFASRPAPTRAVVDGRMSAAAAPAASLKPAVRPGTLYVVATPIGHLGDITARARAVLAAVDLIACEDTRTTAHLLTHLGLQRPLLAYHDHNETFAAERLAEELATGKSIALVSDAGTPAISDPGFRIVRACRRRGLRVEPVPGACALAAVVSASGLPSDGFLFAGFLPPKTSARVAFLKKYREFDYTLALYESCHRIEKFSAEIIETLGPARVVCVAREVTKLHESFLVGGADEVRTRLLQGSLKGEFVVLIAPVDFVL